MVESSEDEFRTVARSAEFLLKERGSRFIARAFHIASRSEAESTIARLRKKEYDATHHCSAIRLGIHGEEERFNDDGEPSGTAGQPILRQIEARELTDTLVVVARYYGGTKLGTGGLIRAYGDSASGALDLAGIQIHVLRDRFEVDFAYDDTAAAMITIESFDSIVKESAYTDRTRLILGIRRSQGAAFEERFRDATGGRGEVKRLTATS